MQNGQALEAKFDEIRTMDQRSLMRGEMVYTGEPSEGGLACSALARSMTTLASVI